MLTCAVSCVRRSLDSVPRAARRAAGTTSRRHRSGRFASPSQPSGEAAGSGSQPPRGGALHGLDLAPQATYRTALGAQPSRGPVGRSVLLPAIRRALPVDVDRGTEEVHVGLAEEAGDLGADQSSIVARPGSVNGQIELVRRVGEGA